MSNYSSYIFGYIHLTNIHSHKPAAARPATHTTNGTLNILGFLNLPKQSTFSPQSKIANSHLQWGLHIHTNQLLSYVENKIQQG